MKTFNECIIEYKRQLALGDIRVAYKRLIDFMMGLRNHFASTHSELKVSGSIYQGYMDMSYFAITTHVLRARKLKIAIVLLHSSVRFEVWLAGVNKKNQRKYRNVLKDNCPVQFRIYEDVNGCYSIIKSDLVLHPDFDDTKNLSLEIEERVLRFIREAEALILRFPE